MGMLVATSVIVVHLVAGLGVFWPLVTVAGYGAGVLLTPSRPAPAIKRAPRVELEQPGRLRQRVRDQRRVLVKNQAPDFVSNSLAALEAALERVLDNWDYLVDFPEHQVTVRSMIRDYIPSLVQAYLAIPDRDNARAVRDVTGSFDLLRGEADSIYEATIRNSLNRLEDHNRILHMQFGRLPLEGDGGDGGGVDKHAPGAK
ncbi:hypothetical protein [Corynebacterium efficiens YS-314]|uniref:5-bromo-4-chloroindolyl phosphate hydrolysis protein n=2 Tax=Corynebacterium efficiens TaxID=152794 RepID=Q8FTM3_COREF|nr:hypothetical protein [Corynebacterium efficiens YS-314]